MRNKSKEILIKLGVSDEASFLPFYPEVRDRADISVLKCEKSGVIILSRTDHIDVSYYSKIEKLKYWGTSDRETTIELGLEDIQRRCKSFQSLITNKKWLDVGTGAGGILDVLNSLTTETVAVEPQNYMRKCLKDVGYNVLPSITDVPIEHFEIVTLFHVLEHFTDPLTSLLEVRKSMVDGGKIIIEVPHARDVLISLFDIEAFKAFTFWSEHLILHTQQSLLLLLKKAGFTNITINGCQRYPLANHLYWLNKGKPGGHVEWDFLRADTLDIEYEKKLKQEDKTDTLIAIAQK